MYKSQNPHPGSIATEPSDIATGTIPRHEAAGTIPRHEAAGTIPRHEAAGTIPRHGVAGQHYRKHPPKTEVNMKVNNTIYSIATDITW